MEFPNDLLYTADHEWVRIEGNMATVGITAFACSELGDIVYVDINSLGEELEKHDVFGSVEAVKTVSDLFMPVAGRVIEVNSGLNDTPEMISNDPYNEGWLVKIALAESATQEGLMHFADYRKKIGV